MQMLIKEDVENRTNWPTLVLFIANTANAFEFC